MKRTIGIIALAVFIISASIDPTSVNPLHLIGWGAIIIVSLSVVGMTLTHNQQD